MELTRFLHPILSGFPATLVVLLLIVEGLRFFARARGEDDAKVCAIRKFLVVALMVSVLASFLSGYSASNLLNELSKEHEALISSHHSFGKLLLVNSILLGVFFWLSQVALHGKVWFGRLYLAMLIGQFALSFATGGKGGEMVFDYGIGVVPRVVN